ncbi:MAG: zinc ribbon domain-containing protein [Thermoplasmata archaeon]|nr:MAG: zinc ribbon domain-containing protein [Thermoplasmata archaeon]
MYYEKWVEERRALAIFLGLLIIGFSMVLSVQREPATGNISINIMIVILGILTSILLYIALTFTGYRGRSLIRMRFCVGCGRSIPFEAVICPYCRHDYEK